MLSFLVKIIVLVFFYAILHSAYSLDYRDLEKTDKSCPTRDKCQGYRNNLNYLNRSCECDSACSTYNDCCIDVRRRSSGRPMTPSNIICLNYGSNTYTGIYAVAKCSSDWNGPQEIREKCEGPADFSDPVSAAPATIESQETTYKNLYCAECNNVQKESLKIFAFRLACNDVESMSQKELLDKLSYDKQLNTWGVNRVNTHGNSDFKKCKIFFELPDYLKSSVRFCRANIISQCARDWTRQQVKRACEEYMAVVFDTSRAYRNPHCAICNHKTASELSCTSDEYGRRETFSFSTIIDINFNVKDSPTCDSKEVYDPYFKKCKRLVCALPGYVAKNSKCVPRG